MKEEPIYLINPISDKRIWNEFNCIEVKTEDNWYIKYATISHVYITNNLDSPISIALDYQTLFYYFIIPFENKYELLKNYE